MAANEALFQKGDPLMADYLPGADIPAGEVIVLANFTVIPHLALKNAIKGSVAAGKGIYECTADGALAAGDKVHWDNTANKVSKTAAAGARKHFGFVAPDSSAAADGDKVKVIHDPDGSAI
jgi:predicted RecA/RadA family phage recombinase